MVWFETTINDAKCKVNIFSKIYLFLELRLKVIFPYISLASEKPVWFETNVNDAKCKHI